MGAFDIVVESGEDLELGNFVVDGVGLDLFSHNFIYSSTLSFSFYHFVPGY